MSTEGILVFLAIPLNQKDNIRITEAAMIRLYDVNNSIGFWWQLDQRVG
jgi:hypothetical protein